jgi:spore germination protein GerM
VVVAESLKVPKDKFEAAIRALLNTPPTPMSDIPRKRESKAKQAKKRG